MKVSDYIVQFFIQKGITDVFGYPGGMVTHLMDSFSKFKGSISAHVNYHEQGAAFAACGYAQVSLRMGVAYATSGPGATNLLTGLCNAYFDSIPVIFLTGNVNVYEGKGSLPVRQKGFQEMDVCSVVSSVTKYCSYVRDEKDIRYHLEKAFHLAISGRPGPVALDIPMNVQRAEIHPEELRGFVPDPEDFFDVKVATDAILGALRVARRPCVLAGAGIQSSGTGRIFRKWIERAKIPVVTSMLAVDVMQDSPYHYGFVGAYGARSANFILAKSDLVIALGSRLDLRQTGADTDFFAVNAKLVRVDIDPGELSNKIKKDELQLPTDLKRLLPELAAAGDDGLSSRFSRWIAVCDEIQAKLSGLDERLPNVFVRKISKLMEKDAIVTTDVGQNQVWVAQSFHADGQRILFSGGHGAMGYSLPAAIGAHYASKQKVYAFMGDGGLQMNVQELQFIAREGLPIKIILLNNASLGMIRHFQEMYFDSNFTQTQQEGGYTVPDFRAVAAAYRIPYCKVTDVERLLDAEALLRNPHPAFLEIALENRTYVFPKLAVGKLNQDQEPQLDRELYTYLSGL